MQWDTIEKKSWMSISDKNKKCPFKSNKKQTYKKFTI